MRPLAKQIAVFLLLVFAFSSLPYYLMIHTGHIGAGNGLVVALVMWCPAFAAFATCAVFKIDVRTLGWKWSGKYVTWAYLIPILYALPVYLASWAAIPGSLAFAKFAAPLGVAFGFPLWPRTTTLVLAIPLYAVLGVISSTARAPEKRSAGVDFFFRVWSSRPALPGGVCSADVSGPYGIIQACYSRITTRAPSRCSP